MPSETIKYDMSFTAGAAMLNETHAVASALVDCDGDWDKTKEVTFKENLMQKDKADFNEFYNESKYVHPELEKVTEQTVAKMRQVIFRILEQLEIIEDAESGILRRPYLSEAVERLIVKDDPKWLAIYLYSNNEINNLAELYA